MLKPAYALIFTSLLVLIGCVPGRVNLPTPSFSSGIEGQVTEGPMCPGPIRVGATDCPDQPYQATLTIMDAKGKQVESLQTDVNGNFKVSLPPGTYTLHPESDNPMPHASDHIVIVTAGEYTHVDVIYDTGMR